MQSIVFASVLLFATSCAASYGAPLYAAPQPQYAPAPVPVQTYAPAPVLNQRVLAYNSPAPTVVCKTAIIFFFHKNVFYSQKSNYKNVLFLINL